MGFYSLFLIALAVALDAFGVALSIGLNKSIRLKSKFIFCLTFGFFQYFFSFIGTYLGLWFTKYITSLPGIIGGIVIIIVGVLMIKEGYEEKDQCLLFNPKMYFVLGASVSIDALVVSFTAFNTITSSVEILAYTIFIGIVTVVLTAIAFIISKYLNKISIISKYADFIGGIILVLFGARMVFLG